MTIVEPGILEQLFHNACNHDIEYKATAFWQAYLQTKFRAEDGFSVIAEYAPHDESRSRSDYTVLYYDEQQGLLTRLLIGEAKRPGTHPKHAEADASNTAKEVLQAHNMSSIYVMTTWGCKFRLWLLTSNSSQLEPIDEKSEHTGDRSSYISANSPDAVILENFISTLKDQSSQPSGSTQELQHPQSDSYQASSSKQPQAGLSGYLPADKSDEIPVLDASLADEAIVEKLEGKVYKCNRRSDGGRIHVPVDGWHQCFIDILGKMYEGYSWVAPNSGNAYYTFSLPLERNRGKKAKR